MADDNKKSQQQNEELNGEDHFEEQEYMGKDDYYKQYVTHEKSLSRRKCNLCGKSFKPHTRYERFCNECKQADELYHFYE